MHRASARAEPSSQAYLLAELGMLANRLGELETASGYVDEAAALTLTADLTDIVPVALSLVTALEQLEPRAADEPAFEQEPETWVGVRGRAPTAPSVGDVCFACSFELSHALRSLSKAHDLESRLEASETARRKLYRAIQAISQVVPADVAADLGAASARRHGDVELESALAVRKLYAHFRQSLRRPVDESQEGVLTALRYAAGALATLTASTHYSAVRVSDASLLRRQRERLLEWSRAGKPSGAGMQLLDDIWTCADLLRDINRRQELRAHDVELIRKLAADTSLDRAGWVTHLDRLAGLDDALDKLTARLRVAQNTDLLVDILVQLSFLV